MNIKLKIFPDRIEGNDDTEVYTWFEVPYSQSNFLRKAMLNKDLISFGGPKRFIILQVVYNWASQKLKLLVRKVEK
jgi:hypothetical protein